MVFLEVLRIIKVLDFRFWNLRLLLLGPVQLCLLDQKFFFPRLCDNQIMSTIDRSCLSHETSELSCNCNTFPARSLWSCENYCVISIREKSLCLVYSSNPWPFWPLCNSFIFQNIILNIRKISTHFNHETSIIYLRHKWWFGGFGKNEVLWKQYGIKNTLKMS